ncbi:MAG: adenylyl-sulfate kinase [Gammaproteobacteria bacterium]|nr:adenylyl-sulfate kinase [Gammaproteobacteria bacterium]
MQVGTVYWITGLAGAGKSTTARGLAERLRRSGRAVFVLDGDDMRAIIPGTFDHTLEERRQLAQYYAALANRLQADGIDVVCATISMFQSIRDWNREHNPTYVEIFLDVGLDELKRRDQKGIYSGQASGQVRDVIGLDLGLELPRSPDITLTPGIGDDAEAVLAQLWRALMKPTDPDSTS